MLLDKLSGDMSITSSERRPDIVSFTRQQDVIIRDSKHSHGKQIMRQKNSDFLWLVGP